MLFWGVFVGFVFSGSGAEKILDDSCPTVFVEGLGSSGAAAKILLSEGTFFLAFGFSSSVGLSDAKMFEVCFGFCAVLTGSGSVPKILELLPPGAAKTREVGRSIKSILLTPNISVRQSKSDSKMG